MNKLAAGLTGILFLLFASVASAAYVILLKDGRSVTTQEYWEENDQIKIKQYGGVVGIAKDNVLKIEETDDVRTLVIKSSPENASEKEAGGAEGAAEEKGNEKNEKDDGAKKEKKADKAPSKKKENEKNAFLKAFDSLKKRFLNVENMTREEIFQFDKDLAALRNKILEAGLGGAYADQLVALSEMGSKAEEVYNRRNQ